MMCRFFIYIFKIVMCVIFLFLMFYMFVISVANSVQNNSENISTNLAFKNDNFNKIYDYENNSFDYFKENSKEVIVINAVSYCPGIFTFSPSKSLQSSYVTDAADYLKDIPGFTSIRSGGTNTDPVFRGMFGSRIRILVDNGEILGACCSRMDPASAYIYPGTFDILNLIKGPQTVLLGPVASGGILQFERYHPYFSIPEIKLRSNVTFGSNNKIDKNIDSIMGNKYGYIRLIGNVSHSDNYRDGNGLKVHSAWYKWNTDAILLLNFGPSTFYEINIGQGNGSANYAVRAMDGLCFFRESYAMKIETTSINNILDKIGLYTWYNYMNHIMGGNTINIMKLPDKHFDSCANNVDRCIWGARGIVVNQWEHIECHSGIDMQINQHRKIKCDSTWHKDIVNWDSGIFSELVLNILSNRKFIGGIRLDRYSTFSFDRDDVICNQYSTIYPAGFIRYENNLHPLLYYIGIGTSKRFPDYWELLCIDFNKSINTVKYNILNKKLFPERTVQIDAGINFQYAQFSGWISSYTGYIKNYILYHYDIFNGMVGNINYINNINARIFGTESELNYQFNDNWCIKSNIMWNCGVNINSKHVLPKMPPLEGTLICQWKNAYYNMTVLWRLVKASQYYLDEINALSSQIKPKNYIKSPGFGVLSANLTWINSKYYTLSAGIDNVFNNNYREYLNSFHHDRLGYDKRNMPIYEPGRILWIKTEIIL